jgi:hypothetical protein
MSPVEGRSWMALLGLCPAYLAYFAIQIAAPPWLTGMWPRIACLAAASLTHTLIFLIGWLVLKARERGQGQLSDERDNVIETRATRRAYYLLMTGTVIVGMFMPFSQQGWAIVNGTVLTVVLAEVLRNVLTVSAYRRSPRLAH